jgi:CheY-like chemotaxis protein
MSAALGYIFTQTDSHAESVERDRTGRERGETVKVAKPRAVVVEDELFVAWHIESMLTDADVEVCGIATHGMDAIEKAVALRPQIVVMDINLGEGMDGIEAARRIRELTDATIVFVTAYGDAKTLKRIELELPGTEVLSKPTSSAKLKTAIEKPAAARH